MRTEDQAAETPRDWRSLLDEYGPGLRLYALRFGDAARADDLVQEAFVRFWRHREEVGNVPAYLARCVRTAAIDRARECNSRNRRERQRDTRAALVTPPEGPIVAAERAAAIADAVDRLPAEQAEVVTLKIWSGLTLAEIADVTDSLPGTVASRYRLALGRLRDSLRPLLSENGAPRARPQSDRSDA